MICPVPYATEQPVSAMDSMDLEMPVEDENYAYVYATVQVLPEFQMIEIGGGNG